MSVVVAALYQFVRLDDAADLRQALLDLTKAHQIKGTLLLAHEGINGTVAGSRQAIDALKNFLDADGRFNNLEYKESFASSMPFYRMKVRLKKEIVTIGIESVDPTKNVGTYVDGKAWNELLNDPDVVVIDTRNDYEFDIGTFKNAINPNTQTFREFPEFVRQNFDPKKHKKVAMFCTGGIRCEKASSFMLDEGFESVFHLKGGILKYLETMPENESLWDGECFVFDHRTAVAHGLEEGDHATCFGCRKPVSQHDRSSPKYVAGISCPACFDVTTVDQKKRAEQRQNQIMLAKKRGGSHIGERR